MEWYIALPIGFGLLLFMTFSGLPIFTGFLALNIIGVLLFFGSSGFGLFINSLVATLTSETLIAVPLFLLVGEFLFRSNSIDELYKALDVLVGMIILGVFFFQIREQFDSLDLKHLEKLRESEE